MTKGGAASARGTLSRETILRTALRVIDDEGMEALSMRRLAAELGVFPTALYHHVENKGALLRGVVALALAEVEAAGHDGGRAVRDWPQRLRSLCRAFRGLAGAHPRLVPHLVFSPETTLEEYGVYEALYRILADAGLPPAAIVRASTLVFAYATGFTLAEAGGTLGPLTRAERDDLAALPRERFPTTHRLMARLAAVDLDADFEFGLDVILAGLATLAAETTARPSRPEAPPAKTGPPRPGSRRTPGGSPPRSGPRPAETRPRGQPARLPPRLPKDGRRRGAMRG